MKIERINLPIYSVQENGLISSPNWAEGRLIPAVVLNRAQGGEELKEFLNIHVSTVNQGDVITQWTLPAQQFFKPKIWYLKVIFTKPKELSLYIEFVLDKHSSLIDAIFQSRGLHLMYGFVGDKISKRTTQDMILMEIPDLDQDLKWNSLLRDILRERLRGQKVPKKEIRFEVEKQIKNMREILHYRKQI